MYVRPYRAMELGGWACASAYSPKQPKTPFLLRSVAASLLPSWQKEPFLPARGSSLGTSPAPQFHGPIGPYTCMITSFKSQILLLKNKYNNCIYGMDAGLFWVPCIAMVPPVLE